MGLAAAAGLAVARSHALLVDAAGRGDLARVQAFLRAGVNIEQRDADGRTAILAATDGNYLDVVRELIAGGANVNAQDNRRDSAFLLAGARAVIGAGWRQPSAAAALIAAGFAVAAPQPGDPLTDARALSRVLRRYREVVAGPALMDPDGWRVALAAMIGVDLWTLPATSAPPLRVGDLRASYAWAGWRVCLRDRTCLEP